MIAALRESRERGTPNLIKFKLSGRIHALFLKAGDIELCG
jgi:hypothetical protein